MNFMHTKKAGITLAGLVAAAGLLIPKGAAQQDNRVRNAVEKLQQQTVALLEVKHAFRQTVRRFNRLPGDRGLEPVDTIRLDVVVESGVPRFSWPGENRFENYSLAQMLNGPVTEAGSLALHIQSVLLAGGPKTQSSGEETIEGRRVLRFDLHVPSETSAYSMRVDDVEAALPYDASIWIDAETGDLVRIQGRVEKDPRIKIAGINDRVDFRAVHIGIADFVLPASGAVLIEDVFGGAKRSEVIYENYRPYESAGEGETEPEPAGFPSGLVIRVKLEEAIDGETAAVGDPIRGLVTSNVKKDGKEWVPKGAVVHGRIQHLQRVVEPSTHYVLGLTFSTVELEGRPLRFSSSVVDAGPFHGLMEMPGEGVRNQERRGQGRLLKFIPGYLYWETVRLKIRQGLPVTLRVGE